MLTDGTCVSPRRPRVAWPFPALLWCNAPRRGCPQPQQSVIHLASSRRYAAKLLTHASATPQNSEPGWEVTWEPQTGRNDPDCKAFPMFNEHVRSTFRGHAPPEKPVVSRPLFDSLRSPSFPPGLICTTWLWHGGQGLGDGASFGGAKPYVVPFSG
jgi:hypothetical protein